MSRKDIGFESDMNEVSIYYNEDKKSEKLSKTTKLSIAKQIVQKIVSSLS